MTDRKEKALLRQFLLDPAALPEVISLEDFTDLFPRALRSNPQVPVLYRELQHERARTIDHVDANISSEVKRGVAQRREVVRARRAEEKENGVEQTEGDQREVEMEVDFYGQTSNLPTNNHHTLSSIIPELQAACVDVEIEIAAMDDELETVREDVRSIIGDLSDLRYGRFNKAGGGAEAVGQEVLDGLKRLEDLCANLAND
ncbi:MAG: hypothetical protein M1817_002639 [Caeruleum heppii]|nr:MAG: hypothetical protein M1817_002639 [Caeruleum heppii]